MAPLQKEKEEKIITRKNFVPVPQMNNGGLMKQTLRSWSINSIKQWTVRLFMLAAASFVLLDINIHAATEAPPAYMGSTSCRTCHEKFYKLWSTSHHGLAMQPYTESFAKANLTPQSDPIVIDKISYRAVTNQGSGYVIESGPLSGLPPVKITPTSDCSSTFLEKRPTKRFSLSSVSVSSVCTSISPYP
jgi:hypothetical protein